MSDELKVYTIKEVGEILKVSRRTIYNYLDDGTLKGVRIGKHIRFTHEEIKRLIYGDTEEE
ncbi:helix-turn-helix domain-containing protein [Veillonella sp. R32]|uniref:helix-turn-helix domain-containing protein n=1 Tax=Veillonella sp. R32 TaxID=2021312 RepID=UPI001389ACC3|nr:helix-turn-helix domain-containing protein [Veillonella sp. R32]KAF1679114.1 hypothetical protein VER_09695 [Veillonella sp. R32]